MIRLTSFLWVWFHCVCPLIPSCNTYRLTWVSLTLDLGYLFVAAPAKHSHCSLPWSRGISLLATPPDLELGVAPLSPPASTQPTLLGHGMGSCILHPTKNHQTHSMCRLNYQLTFITAEYLLSKICLMQLNCLISPSFIPLVPRNNESQYVLIRYAPLQFFWTW